ncbi:DUF58 domain-containing protein [Cohnella laeviribosi]|jgi:uncharacterized protein (DUF58 family)|uniref:DUF58 domain-containing protein n=1 Tax=Cohnella laeviribosi TaxID=380174 RepID=UPI00037489DF|nr:DUF58 domain-containing protein [Cohnella laeviribosi]
MTIVWLLAVFGGIYLLQHGLYRIWGKRGIAYERSFSKPYVYAGQTVVMTEEIVNRKLLPIPWLRVETVMPSMLRFPNRSAETAISSGQLLQHHASLFSLPPFTRVVRRHEVLCVRRGIYRVPSLACTFGDLFGTAFGAMDLKTNCSIVVYPRVKDAAELPLPARRFMQSALGMPELFLENHHHVAGVRAYRSGDSLRQVNWNATAKTGQLLVNKRETMLDNEATVILNAELMDDATNRRMPPEAFEEALSYAASVIRHIQNSGGKAGLVYNGKSADEHQAPLRVPPQAGSGQLLRILRLMAGFEPVVRRELSHVLEELLASGLRRANVLLISAFLTPSQERMIERLRRAGNRVETLVLYRERRAGA